MNAVAAEKSLEKSSSGKKGKRTERLEEILAGSLLFLTTKEHIKIFLPRELQE